MYNPGGPEWPGPVLDAHRRHRGQIAFVAELAFVSFGLVLVRVRVQVRVVRGAYFQPREPRAYKRALCAALKPLRGARIPERQELSVMVMNICFHC
jgi:hypothetical protein